MWLADGAGRTRMSASDKSLRYIGTRFCVEIRAILIASLPCMAWLLLGDEASEGIIRGLAISCGRETTNRIPLAFRARKMVSNTKSTFCNRFIQSLQRFIHIRQGHGGTEAVMAGGAAVIVE